MKAEEESYRREIEELEAKKKLRDNASLEALRAKLREKRLEQDLYLPSTCRRLRSYFLDPRRPIGSGVSTTGSILSNDLSECLYLKDSTNFQRNEEPDNISERTKGMTSWISQKDIQVTRKDNIEKDRFEYRPRNRKYSARYAHRSLENTNVRSDEGVYEIFYGSRARKLRESKMDGENNKENKGKGIDISTSMKPSLTYSEDLRDSSGWEERKALDAEELEKTKLAEEERAENLATEEKARQDEVDHVENVRVELEKETRKDHRGYESERSYPWMRKDPQVQNLSEKMYLYLSYKELKEKIDDLSRRELHACSRQRWDDALRLRDMKNELELIREKKLCNTQGLNMNEELKQAILTNIEKRERELGSREKACTDSTMYSDGAKVLWEKWVKEDDRFVIKDASTQMETLMKQLEEEFQNLAVQDKERIAKTYKSVIQDSFLQNRHRLNAELVVTDEK